MKHRRNEPPIVIPPESSGRCPHMRENFPDRVPADTLATCICGRWFKAFMWPQDPYDIGWRMVSRWDRRARRRIQEATR